MAEVKNKRKFQVCNGYLLEFDQLARVLDFLSTQEDAGRVSREAIIDGSGLSNRQIESLVSIGAAMGVIQRGKQTLTPFSKFLVQHDIFMENKGTLEWCHYLGAGSPRNLIWHEIFNSMLPRRTPETQQEWMDYLRSDLAGRYTDRTIGKHLYEEVRFIVDAYLVRNFKKLQLLYQGADERISRRRYLNPEPEVLAAMIYAFGAKQNATLLQVKDLVEEPASPGLLLALDQATFLQLLEELNNHGWLRLETTHNLAQVRLLEGYEPLSFLSAFYEKRCPEPSNKQDMEERMLL